MSDINPILDRLARGGGGPRLFDHHERAAHHHEKAAEQHRLAAQAERSGDTAGAAGYATRAWGHGAHAQEHANESLKGYAGSDEPPLGYTGGDTSGAPTLDPTAANTPGIR
jgi:hypothetical protein